MRELVALEAALLAASGMSAMVETNKVISMLAELLEEDPSIVSVSEAMDFGEYADFQKECIRDLLKNKKVFGG